MPDIEQSLRDLMLAPYIVKAMALIGVQRRGGSNMFRHQLSTFAILLDYKVIDPVLLKPNQLDDYARVVGAVLARAHAQSADPRLLTGYVDGATTRTPGGNGFDDAIATFAVAYADQTEADHDALLRAVKAGRLPAIFETGV